MKLHKKLIIVAAAVIVMGGAGTGVAFAMQPEEQPKQVAVEQAVAAETVEEAPRPVETPPVVTEPVVEEEQPVAPEETVDSVLGAAGWNETDRECVDMIRERAPRWFIDVETTKKFIEVTDHYIGMCYGVWHSTPDSLNRDFQVKTDLDMGIIQQ